VTNACAPGTDTADCTGAGPGPGQGPAAQGDNSCQWAFDGECDDANYPNAVTNACPPGTDTADCTGAGPGPVPGQGPAAQGDNSCQWAFDGECDDPNYPNAVTNACAPGTDTADCTGAGPGPGPGQGPAAQGENSCQWAFDGECDDPNYPNAVTNACPPGTDTADCTTGGGGPQPTK
jgi:hypothetical protein